MHVSHAGRVVIVVIAHINQATKVRPSSRVLDPKEWFNASELNGRIQRSVFTCLFPWFSEHRADLCIHLVNRLLPIVIRGILKKHRPLNLDN